MAKELPYYKHEPGEYLTGNIQSCSDAAQGIWNNVQAIYWQRSCDITKKNLYKMGAFRGRVAMEVDGVPVMIERTQLLDELIDENIIKVRDGKIVINFLLKQFQERSAISEVNAKNGAKGAAERERRKKVKELGGDVELSHLTQCKADEGWKDLMCIQHGLKFHYVLEEWLDKFDNHAPKHPNIDKYKFHFNNWMRKQDKAGDKTPKDSTKTSLPKPFPNA